MSIQVIKGGLLTTVQDQGRPGWQQYGVVMGGAADPFAARVANLLTGNAPGAAVLEMAVIGPSLRFEEETLVAWCGAEFEPSLEGRLLPKNRPLRIPAGGVVDFGAPRTGTMAWLAIAGGIDVPSVMGSRSTYLAAAIGGVEGRALATGDRLPGGALSTRSERLLASLRSTSHPTWSIPPERLGLAAPRNILRVMRGPEWSWFCSESRYRLFREVYEVTRDGNRMGVRLSGQPLTLETPREMTSAAVQHGVIQVPASGQPILLGADRQTLGGYPRIGCVATVDLGALAQLRPGEPVHFQEISVPHAHALLEKRENDLAIARCHMSHLI